jgi:glycosyltransferase involved in cell wall biosynthesis
MNILFIQAGTVDPFAYIHKAFNDTGLANSKLLFCEDLRHKKYGQYSADFPQNIFTYSPDGDVDLDNYYYSRAVEENARTNIGILAAVREILKHHHIDVICAHHRFATFLYGMIDLPIVLYCEYPSLRTYGFDPQYPPMEYQLHFFASYEALMYYTLIKCQLALISNKHSLSFYPEYMHHKFVLIPDGFDANGINYYNPDEALFEKEEGLVYIGFLGRVLSSEKGYEQFLQVTQRLADINPNVRFVLIGQKRGESYGHERFFLDRLYGEGNMSFSDYLFEKYDIDPYPYIFLESDKSYRCYSSCIHHVDFFMAPSLITYGAWSLLECLARGKIVIASDRASIPEFITHEHDGFMLPYDDIDSWVNLADDVASNLDKYRHIGENAKIRAARYDSVSVAKNYLDIFSDVIKGYKKGTNIIPL